MFHWLQLYILLFRLLRSQKGSMSVLSLLLSIGRR
jgi:hypothetical protein